MRITGIQVSDIRFPTSRTLDGSDAVHSDPDYSAAYVVLQTNTEFEGHGLTFTIGRGNEVCVVAARAIGALIVGMSADDIEHDPRGFYRRVTDDSQLRWIGPEKGAVHLAAAAVINAVWDLLAKRAGLPLWRYLADLTPEQIIAAVDFRYITDALTPDAALAMLQELAASKRERVDYLRERGLPAYTTSAGWIGYDDDKIRRLCREGVAVGWSHFKIKVGRDRADDIRRCRLVREVIGPDRFLMVDANQAWEVEQAIAWMRELAPFKPWWIEEPTSPDDVLGHARIARELEPLGIGVATGEMCQNRVMFKQLLQAKAIRFCQIDSCRLGGVNEVLAVLLLAAHFGVPVCPHAGGVGLCEYVQHLAAFDYIAVSGSLDHRVVEYVDHLHEHFENPCSVKDGRYVLPTAPGYSIEMKPQSRCDYEYPTGVVWR